MLGATWIRWRGEDVKLGQKLGVTEVEVKTEII
jgi:hypothetical protein